jgi:hypothetical protein
MKKLLVVLALSAVPVFGSEPPRKIVTQWPAAIETMESARAILTALGGYALEHNRYPDAASMTELRMRIEPDFIRTTPMTDAWGTPFLYRVSADGKTFLLASAGSDKKYQDESMWTSGYSTDSADDLVYKSDEFTREWVIQRVCP